MAAEQSTSKNYYVYLLFREDGVTPFYVGLGQRSRWLDHERLAKPGQGRHKDSIILGMRSRGIALPKAKLENKKAAALSAAASQIALNLDGD